MGLNDAVLPGNSVQYLGDTVTDIFPDKITDKQRSQPNPDKRIDKKQKTTTIDLQALGEKLMGKMHGIFQKYTGQSSNNTYQKTQNDDKISFFNMTYPPT